MLKCSKYRYFNKIQTWQKDYIFWWWFVILILEYQVTNTYFTIIKKRKLENNPGILIVYILKISKKIKTSLFPCTDNQIERCTGILLTPVKTGNGNHILYTEKTGRLKQMTLIRKTKTSSFTKNQNCKHIYSQNVNLWNGKSL